MIELRRWRVYRIQARNKEANNTVRLVGYVSLADEGYVSAAVKRWNPQTSVATTSTGEDVHLVGEPGGESRDADHAWLKFGSKFRVTDYTEISMRYLPKRKRVAA